MEKVKFIFEGKYGDTKTYTVHKLKDKKNCGLSDADICALFEEFMKAAGFSPKNIINYFKD